MADKMEYKLADTFINEVQDSFDRTDRDHDGRLTSDELKAATGAERWDVDGQFHSAAHRFLDDYIESCGHKEKTKSLEILRGSALDILVVDREDLSRLRTSFKAVGRFQDPLPKPIDKDFAQIIKESFESLDWDKDQKVTKTELKRLEDVPVKSAPSKYIQAAAARYLEYRLDLEGQKENISVREKISDQTWVPGERHVRLIPTGKTLIAMPTQDPGHWEPAKYADVVHEQRFATKEDLDRWSR
jgi:Ca2+-binding EF-hand superfamily protein